MGVNCFKVTKRAREDLLAIGRHTEKEWGVKQRNHYLKQFDDAFKMLGQNPMIGKACEDVLPGYRKISQGSHVIYYKVSDLVEIIRVLHERMDPDTRLP